MAQEDKNKEDEKIAFIIAPIGPEGSDIRRRIDGIIIALLRPVLKSLGFEALASHSIDESGSITDQIIDFLLNADLVICDLTYNNPNVMYELAIRHAVQLPVVLIAEEGTEIPFDIGDQRTTFFANDPYGLDEFKPTLEKKIKAALKQRKLNNPISRVIDHSVITKMSPSEGHAQEFLISQITDIREMLNQLSLRLRALSEKSEREERVERLATLKEDADLKRTVTFFDTISIAVEGPRSKIMQLLEDLTKIPYVNVRIDSASDSEAVLRIRLPASDRPAFTKKMERLKKIHKELRISRGALFLYTPAI